MPDNSVIMSIFPQANSYNGYPLPVTTPEYKPVNGEPPQPSRIGRLFGKRPIVDSLTEMAEHNRKLEREIKTYRMLDQIWTSLTDKKLEDDSMQGDLEKDLPLRYLRQLDKIDEDISNLKAIRVRIPSTEEIENERFMVIYRYIRRGNGGHRYLVSFEEQEKNMHYRRVLTKNGEYQEESLVIDENGSLSDLYNNPRGEESDIQSVLFTVNDICESPNGVAHDLVDVIQSVAERSSTEIQTIAP